MLINDNQVTAEFDKMVELYEKIRSGAIRVLGKVGECEMPHIVMPLTIEPSKPRLCHDDRFLNLIHISRSVDKVRLYFGLGEMLVCSIDTCQVSGIFG